MRGALLTEREVKFDELDESLSEDSVRRGCCEPLEPDGIGEKAPGRRYVDEAIGGPGCSIELKR